MIVDDMIAVAPYMRPWLSESHIVRVPFEVFPLDLGTEVIHWNDSAAVNRVIPKHIGPDWFRLPYRCLTIVSQKSEPAVAWVMEGGKPFQFAAVILILTPKAVSSDRVLVTNVVRVELNPESNGILVSYPMSPEAWIRDIRATERHFRDDQTYTNYGLEKMAEAYNKEHIQFDAQHIATRVLATVALLNCRNIVSEEVKPDHRLQAKRIRQGRLPLIRHHVLTVHRVTRHSTRGAAGMGEPLAVHWVRGHFKTYSEERPLLGRHAGRFWFSAHLAGRDEDRFVKKDYELEDE